jgi:tetratricopeptide (TPR) repeat protein
MPLKRAHEAGLESGDIEFSMMCVSLYVWSQFDFGPLPKLEREIQEAVDLMDLHGQLTMRNMIAGVWQATLNLMGRASGDVCVLAGEAMDETHLDRWKNSVPAIYMWANYYLMVLCYLFGRYDEASERAVHCQQFIRHSFGAVDVCSAVLFETLTNLALERTSRKRGRMNLIKQRMRKMKYWARHSPYNFLGIQFLLEAELSALKGDKDAAFSKYVCAISMSKEVGALQRVALSNERLGKHLLGLGQRADARRYLDDALKYYEEYGAVAKVDHLRREILDSCLDADSRHVPC